MTEIESVSRRYFAGDDLTLEFTVTDADSAAVDITGMTPRFLIVRKVGGTSVISTESSPQTATASLSDAANGEYQIAIAGTNTQGLIGTYRFESEVEDVSGNKTTVSRGYITFKPALITA